MSIPMIDLKIQYEGIKDEINKEINDVLNNTAYICGKKVHAFEEAFARSHSAKKCLGLSSGTDALHLTYWALGIGISSQVETGRLREEMDEVIVPVNTYIATAETITMVGAKPVFVDHDEASFNIDASKIEKSITQNTKAIVSVHLYGQPCDMDPILAIAKKYNLNLIEDCSQAHLAEYRGRKIGTIGDASTFSFYPGKNLGAYGEAGAVMTENEALYERMLRYRQHGAVVRYVHDLEGHNYRMEELQGAILGVKLKYLDVWTEQRRNVASLYREQLQYVTQIGLPREMPYAKHVYHLFVIRAQRRNELMKYLKEHGIDTGLHYPTPLHLTPAYKYRGYRKGDFPIAEKCCDEILSLPMFPEMTEEQISSITNTIKQFYCAW